MWEINQNLVGVDQAGMTGFMPSLKKTGELGRMRVKGALPNEVSPVVLI